MTDEEQEQLAALNAGLCCEEHQCHPLICGCPYDPITLEEAREIWGEDEGEEDETGEGEGSGLDHYIGIVASVERQRKLYLHRLRSQELVHEEMTDD